jgi:hypothetical protein
VNQAESINADQNLSSNLRESEKSADEFLPLATGTVSNSILIRCRDLSQNPFYQIAPKQELLLNKERKITDRVKTLVPFKTTNPPLLISVLLVCFALLPRAQRLSRRRMAATPVATPPKELTPS